ncbi:MAG: CBS domain-containing protein [Pseudomonadota bacterium]
MPTSLASLCRHQTLVTMPATATAREAVNAMREHGVTAIAVLDDNTPARLMGVLSERDLFDALLRDPVDATDDPATPPPEHPGYIKRNEP